MVAAHASNPRTFVLRLAKYLAHAGVASRRSAEALIAEGRVTVAGETILDPARDVADEVAVAVDGRPLAGPEPRAVFALNKPLGVVSTARDTHGRRTVLDLIPGRGLRLYPVGRLDADSAGLILLTNDGQLAHQLTHPSFEVPKTYRARLARGPITDKALRTLRTGVELEDGLTAPARARRAGADAIELTIHEGRNRQVRRMCKAVGFPVVELTRVSFGPLELGELTAGAHRRLSAGEVERLRALSL
jgi:23S rRNA pseudouridine2605 synthase